MQRRLWKAQKASPRIRSRAAITLGLVVFLVVGTSTAAFAEGYFTSFMSQVQPTFTSRDWTDHNNDSAHTVVTLTGCKGNKAGASPGTTTITSVGITLYDGHNQPVVTIKKACGTYDFGRTAADDFYFKVSSINGYTGADRKIFLNVTTVRVDY